MLTGSLRRRASPRLLRSQYCTAMALAQVQTFHVVRARLRGENKTNRATNTHLVHGAAWGEPEKHEHRNGNQKRWVLRWGNVSISPHILEPEGVAGVRKIGRRDLYTLAEDSRAGSEQLLFLIKKHPQRAIRETRRHPVRARAVSVVRFLDFDDNAVGNPINVSGLDRQTCGIGKYQEAVEPEQSRSGLSRGMERHAMRGPGMEPSLSHLFVLCCHRLRY